MFKNEDISGQIEIVSVSRDILTVHYTGFVRVFSMGNINIYYLQKNKSSLNVQYYDLFKKRFSIKK